MTSVLYSYGGAEPLMYIFNGIAMLTTGKCGVIAYIAGTIGSAVTLFIAVFADRLEEVGKWVAWYILSLMILFTPKTTILIQDVITNDKYPVKNVPWVLGEGATAISAVGHYMTKQFETVFNLPSTISYSKSGMMFGSRIIDDLNGLRIQNADTRQNYNDFVAQCVFYDIMLGGKYTFKDLMETDDIWGMITKKASPLRMFPYLDPITKEADFVTCKAGAALLEKEWIKIIADSSLTLGKKYFSNKHNDEAKLALLTGLDTSTQFLLKDTKRADDVIKQKLLTNVLRDGFRYNAVRSNSVAAMQKFGADRAYMQHKYSGWVSGELAAKTIPFLKLVIEGAVYAFFPMTMIVCLISFSGYQTLLNYARI
ncbi:MAG: conjugal transfer protein TraG N-terminal domain-containing protein, partial [Legionellales bacterium]|nr:conjugal transfer protein TraG N-terminal domain-containing protein [Legionellales bacterium]